MKQSSWWVDKSKGCSQKGIRTAVCENALSEWTISLKELVVCAYNRFIYMLDFYETRKVSEHLFYKCNQFLFWVKCTRRLLNSKLPWFTDLVRNKHVCVSLSYLVMLLWQPKAVLLIFSFSQYPSSSSLTNRASIWSWSLGPMAHWRLQTVESKTCTVHIALHPRDTLLTAYFLRFQSQHCSKQVLIGLTSWDM